MKKLVIITGIIFALSFSFANAGHVRGNGTCKDDIVHYNNMKNKRTDAPLYSQSKENYEKAIGKKLAAKSEECEAFIEEALRMIRKPYPTE